MLFYITLTLSGIVLILFLCRDDYKLKEELEEFSSRNTPINLYNGINNTNNRCNQIKKKIR